MNRKNSGRILSVVLILTLAVAALAGCGLSGGDKRGGLIAKIDTDTIYARVESPLSAIMKSAQADSGETEADDELGTERFSFASAQAANKQYYVMYSDLESMNGTFLCCFDAEGKKGQTISLPSYQDGGVTNFSLMPDGSILLVSNEYSEDKEAFLWQMGRYTVAEGKEPELKEVWKKTISEEEDFYPAGMVSTENEIFVMTETDLRSYDGRDGSGKLKADLPKEFSGNICKTPDGRVLLAGSVADGFASFEIDPASGTYQQTKYEVPVPVTGESVASGCGDYAFYAASSDGVYGFKADAPAPVKVFDFRMSDIEIESVTGCAVLSADTMVLIYYNMDYGSEANLFKKGDNEGQGSKVALSLACTYADASLSKAVVRFNKANKKYKIILKEFPYDDEGNNTLNMEIAAGNIPDMLSISGDMPVESYAAKGMFVDLDPFFSGDKELMEHDYLDNVLDASRIDGKMYFICPAFNVMGLIGKKKDFGDTVGVTTGQIEKMVKERGLNYETALGPVTRDGMLSWVLFCAMNEYVDWDRGTCSFGSESFINLLNFCKKFPKKINYEKIDWTELEGAMREGKQLIRDGYLFGFDGYMQERYGYVGDEISFLGYPGDGKNGPVIMNELAVAITRNSDHPEGCWEFLREFYLDQYQQSIDNAFPVSIGALQILADRAMNPKVITYTDENGKEVTEAETASVFLNGREVKLPVPSQEDVDYVMDILRSLKMRTSVDSKITGIINEESSAFFAGQKSAEETADIIQSRVKVYINETK